MLSHIARRFWELLRSDIYRRVLWSRFCCKLLRLLNQDVRYIGIESQGATCFLYADDNAITPYSLATGGFQRSDVEEIVDICRRHGFPLGGLFLDVGANIGTSTVFALTSQAFSRALALEPVATNIHLAEMNVFANRLSDKVRLKQIAASDHAGELTMELSSRNCGDHRIGSRPTAASGQTIKVRVSTLDDILRDESIDPQTVSFVWIDTQGYEGFVLKGAQSLIQARIPFSIEFWPHAMQESGCYETLLDTIEREFAGFIVLGQNGSERIRPAQDIRSYARSLEPTKNHSDLFLVPKAPAGASSWASKS